MTVVVPEREPLDMPPGDAEALGEVVQDVAGAAFHLAVLSGALAGPAASAAGWRGDDAVAAAGQVCAVAVLAEEAAGAVLAAMQRLSAHADRLSEARRAVAALQREQDDDFLAAYARLAEIHRSGAMTPGPEEAAIVEGLRAAELSRRRRHAALLEDVADDAAATARLLQDACAPVGGRGAPGDPGRVLAYLAARLPGWGDAELASRGRALAEGLLGRARPGELEALARRAVSYADAPAFATALLDALGVEGVTGLFTWLAADGSGPSSAVAVVLAGAFSAAEPSGSGRDRVGAVLDATYVGTGDDGPFDAVAAGMAAVLAAAVPGTRGGVRLATVVAWGAQLLRREDEQGVFAGAGAVPPGWDPITLDPAALVIDVLAAAGEPGPAAALFADRGAWDVLLARWWADGGSALGDVIALAGAEPDRAGSVAVRAGLEALGTGLDDGDPSGWGVDRHTAAAVAGPLAVGLTAHPDLLADVLGTAANGSCEGNGDVLRGLGHLTIDPGAAAVLDRVLTDWASVQPLLLEGTSQTTPLPAVAVPAAYLAVRHYGQRLAHSLDAFERQREAESKQFLWDNSAAYVGNLPGLPGALLGFLEPFAARWLGADGRWEIGPDRGLAFDREDAAEAVRAGLLPPGRRDVDAAAAVVELVRQSRTAFDRTALALGSPDLPVPPEVSLWEVAAEAALSELPDRGRDVPGVGRADG